MLEALPEPTRIAAGNRIEAFADAAPEADVILNWTGSRELLRQVWAIAPRVRWIHSRSAGLDELLFPELAESARAADQCARSLQRDSGRIRHRRGALLRQGIAPHGAQPRSRRLGSSSTPSNWPGRPWESSAWATSAKPPRAAPKPWALRVIGLRRADGAEAKRALLAQSDYVVLSAPLTPETRGIIAEPELRAMKPEAVLINVGRGPLVDEAALIAALREKRIAGAALDVFNQEPLPAGHPYFALDNLLLSPHSADHTPDWQQRAMQLFLANFERYRKGQTLQNVVDKRRGY